MPDRKVIWTTQTWGARAASVTAVSPNHRVLTLQLAGPASKYPPEFSDGLALALADDVKEAPHATSKTANKPRQPRSTRNARAQSDETREAS